MRLCSSIVVLCLASSALAQSAGSTPQPTSHETVSQSLLAVFGTHPLVALGERHDSKQDRELEMDLLRHPGFADKVQNTCWNAAIRCTKALSTAMSMGRIFRESRFSKSGVIRRNLQWGELIFPRVSPLSERYGP